jgi:hypothetical protein
MGALCCPHPSPLSREQDWYNQEPSSAETRSVHGYELNKKIARYQRVKQSYATHSVAVRRRRIYEDAVAVLAAAKESSESHPYVLANERAADLERRLRLQSNKWEQETAHLSSPLQRMTHPSYQAILGMGTESAESKRATIHFLLMDLKNNQRDWFQALSFLTQQNPIDVKDYGKTSKMVASWVKWGEKQGLLQK